MTTTRTRGALVTGAGHGLVRSVAGLLADRGYRVILTDLDEQAARQAAAEVGRGPAMNDAGVSCRRRTVPPGTG